ncbi:MAG: hypothetical protein II961_06655 [Candidatus Riflebacteria bacterium]|nr:hypothetical protein [Candidatus Riflebacteria bacterium]
MAEKNRNYSIYLLILALIGAAVFYGCGSATSDAIPAIEYQITGRYNSEFFTTQGNSSARAAQNYTYGPNDNIYIYSESDPYNYADIDREQSTYVLKNLKPGKHYIVFKHVPAGLGNDPMYIVRSTKPVVLTDSLPVQQLNEALNAAKGTVSITGKLLNPNGQPISPTPNLYLWGQKIDVDPVTGQFTTPKMPEGTTADLIVNAVNYKETTNTVTFTENPAYQEMTAVPTTAINEAPTVDLSSSESSYIVNSLVIISATADAKNNQQLEFIPDIQCTLGSVTKDSIDPNYDETIRDGKYIRKYYWNAPSEDCVATISMTVKEKVTGLSSTAKLQITIGTGRYVPNNKPQILSTSIYPDGQLYGGRDYTVTCIATDTDNETLNYSLRVDPSTGSTLRRGDSINSWVWTTPDLDSTSSFNLLFEVKDPKGNKDTATKTVSVGETRPNEPPTIVSKSTSPASNEVQSGSDITFIVKASDPENGELNFTWTAKKGQIVKSSDDKHNASMTWRAPYLNSNTETEITCKVIDPFKSFAIATFTITITPDPNHKAPEVKLAIGGTSDYYNGNIPLFKAGDQISLIGLATDSNQNILIEPKNYCWFVTNPNGNITQLQDKAEMATYTTTVDAVKGDYSVRLTAVDYSNITGEQVADFRINTIPVTEIQCNGAKVDLNTGRMSPKSEHDYKANSKTYDVFQSGETINLVAICSDVETNQTFLDNNASWLLNSTPYSGKNYSPELTVNGLNTLTFTTTDSKGESSATSTYSFFVNTPPVFEVATSTKSGFIKTDVVKLNAKVTDDANGLSLTWMVSYKPKNSSTFTDYEAYSLSGNNPVNNSGNTLTSNIEVNASTLLTLGTGFKFKLIASDSMGTETVNEDIEFSIVDSHEIKPFTVASGGYDINQKPYTFEELSTLSEPYDFEAKQKFSIRSGSNLWEDAMTWKWSDSFWTNDTPGNFTEIPAGNVDGYTLNGYEINDKFGTHTIRLEGKSNEYGIVASRSIDIFINSTPKIAFNNMVDGTIRFDSGSNATFTITIKEDNKNEKLGLKWTLVELNDDCTENESSKETFESHDLTPSTDDKSPVDMAGSTEKNVTVTWNQITNKTLTKGAKRVYVCGYDAYGKAATATVDILVNTLPKFVEVPPENTRIIAIEVPDSSDNGEDYTYFKNQYAEFEGIPVYLIAENPSMQLNFKVNPTDEDGNVSEENIIWKYTAYNSEGATASKTGSLVEARFGIGLNTINVEIRDDLYDKYKKDGVAIYNHMCIATYSADFYIWHSMAWELVNNNKTATALYNAGEGVFYVQYGNNENNFAERYQLRTGVNPTLPRLVPGHVKPEIYLNGTDGEGNPKVIGTYTPKIITFIQSDASKFLMLTNSTDTTNLAAIDPNADSVRYNRLPSDEEIGLTWLASYTIVKIDNPDENSTNKAYNSFGLPKRVSMSSFEGKPYPGDNKFPECILSMTYSDADPTAGAMILKDWSTHPKGAIAAFSNIDYSYDAENTSPLYFLDNSELEFSDYSKVRYLPQLGSSQKLFVTDTNKNRIIRLKSDFSNANTIPATYPIDVCMTKSKYVFSLAEKSDSGNDDAIGLYSIDNNTATLITSFAKFTTQPAQDANYNKKRAGKVINPKSIIYYTNGSGDSIFGGLIILEEGSAPGRNRIQVIRSNKEDWLE